MKVVGVTACPSGVAHTYMAAEALSLAGKKAGIEVKVETQGSAGIENELPPSPKISPSAIIAVNIGAPRDTPATRLVFPVLAIKNVSTIL